MALVYCGTTVHAQYYVSPSGSDNAAGTQSKPFRTIAKALDKVSNGGSVTLAAGTYREGDLKLKNSSITIKGAGSGKTIITGSERVTGWEKHSGDVWKKKGWKTNSQQVFVDGQPIQQVGDRCGWNIRHAALGNNWVLPIVGSNSVSSLFPGSFYYDPAGDVLYCILKDRSNPNNHQMEVSVSKFILDGGTTTDVTVKNLTMRHSNSTQERLAIGMLMTGRRGWTIEDCEFDYGDFCGLLVQGDNHTIRRCTFSNGGSNGLCVNGATWYPRWKDKEIRPKMNSVIENCTITKNNYRGFSKLFHAGGMKAVPGVRGLTFRNNKVLNNGGIGVWFDDGFGANEVSDNIIAGNRHGISYEIGHAMGGDSYSIKVVNNRIYDNDLKGVYISGSSDAVIEYNTLYNQPYDVIVHGMPRGVNESKNNIIRNNILGSSKNGHLILYKGTRAGNNKITNNFYETSNSSIKVGLENDKGYAITHRTVSDLQKAGYGQNAKIGNPKFKNASNGDFRLVDSSPARGRGWQGGEEPTPAPAPAPEPEAPSNDEKENTDDAEETPTNKSNVVIAINAGGDKFTAEDGTVYQADKYFTRGSAVNYSDLTIGGTKDQKLYQTQRLGWFSYEIPVKNGTYKLTIKTAELKYKSNGQRKFDIHAEGKEIFTDVDLFKLGGYAKALDLEKVVEVKDGKLDVVFDIDYRDCRLSGLVVSTLEETNATEKKTDEVSTLIAINAGGDKFTAEDGTVYQADKYFTRGSAVNYNDLTIGGTKDQKLYQTQRLGWFSYEIPVKNGTYKLTIKTAELKYKSNGQRKFDIHAEGKEIFTDVDLFKLGGYAKALDLEKVVEVKDGKLDVVFDIDYRDCRLSALVVSSVEGAAPAEAPKVAGKLVAAINSGADFGHRASDGDWYARDADGWWQQGSRRRATYSTISKTDDQRIFQYEHFGTRFTYGVNAKNGDYLVTLHFAETHVKKVGERIFDVKIEENLVIDNLDIFKKVGYNTAYSVTIPITVKDGHIKFEFIGRELAAIVSGIAIHEAVTAGTKTITEGDEVMSDAIETKAYPNPFTDKLTLQFGKEKAATTLRVYTTTGTLLETHELPEGQLEWEMNTTHLPKGVYMLSIDTQGERPEQKMVVKQ
ncbi:malectin domain-containing carbohydrate-binding protein [Catalinimonas alkaloidigena]|uniref:malectin domain-containing carbohydrate-binding protein n=1 Tax=Catalinimonas alkaloidigena TaxID=1075417 RepID=UPI001C4091F2|nr:malectin domain-containing carbohydrate-binding protein [Catalinimonas alkaloidigena]